MREFVDKGTDTVGAALLPLVGAGIVVELLAVKSIVV